MTKVQRYKVGYYTDEWGMSIISPCLIPDDSGYAVKFEDYCKLEAENERLNHNLSTTEQTMREYQELAAKRMEEIERLKDLCTTMDGQLGKRPCQNNRCLEYNRLAAELAKYRDAPVVAYWYKYHNCFGDEVWATDSNWDGRTPLESKPLIVKPGEEK